MQDCDNQRIMTSIDWMNKPCAPAMAQFWLTREFRETMPRLFPNGILLNSGTHGQEICGYDSDIVGYQGNNLGNLWGLMAERPIYEFSLHKEFPLMWIDSGAHIWFPIKPGTKKRIDWGSIPVFLQWKFSPLGSVAYPFHDGGYAEHGLWCLVCGVDAPFFVPKERKWIDSALRLIYLAQHGGGMNVRYKAVQIYNAVRSCGWLPWSRKAGSTTIKLLCLTIITVSILATVWKWLGWI